MEVAEFDGERPRLRLLATRILGSESYADDIVQEAWLRLSRADAIDDLPAWLTTVVTRLCLDQLRKQRTRSVVEAATPGVHDPIDPEADALLAEMTGDALQVVLEALAPAERAAFVLHDVFGYPFDEISDIMGRSTSAVRQMASRARRKLQGMPEADATAASRAENQRIIDSFLAAARGGELATLLSLLAPDCVMRADLVGQSMGTEPTYEGKEAVAARFNGTRGATPVIIDGELGAAWFQAGSTKVAFVFHLDEARLVSEVELIAAPDVLATMDIERVRRSSSR
jgi:RNA polymerase sigma-70 factor (ECF subfamily)